MDFPAWKLFIDAADLGSLSKVAASYGTTQPNVSRRIGELERECGGRLFQRTGRGVALTELGQRIAPRIRAWLASTEQLANEVRTSAGTPIGKVRIGSLPSTAHPLVSTLYKHMKGHYPLIQLAVREGQGAQLETWLEDGSVDLAILYRSSGLPKNGDAHLVETSTYLVSAAGDPLTSHPTVPFATLHDRPLVLFCRPSSWRNHLEQLGSELGISLNVVLEADSLSLQTQIVAEGGVYALLGPYAILGPPQQNRLRSSKLVDPVVPRSIVLARSRHGQAIHDIAKTNAAGLALGTP